MKAGIFKRQDNGKHIYVRKDRSIGAIEITDVHPCKSEYKVSERVGGKYVNVPDSNGEYFVTVAERVADAPKGVNDCVKALGDYVDSLKRSAEEANDDDFSLNVDGNDSARETMREGTLVPPADAPEGDPVDLDPELAAYHGEADDSDREAVNLLPDDVSPAQSLHDFVAERLKAKGLNVIDTELVEPAPYSAFATQVKMERLHRIDAGGAAPPVFVEKPTDISADGLREILAHKEEVQQEIARKMGMPKELFSPYCGLPPQTVFLSTPSDAKRFVEKHLQAKSSDTPVSRYAASMFARLDAQREIEQVANGSADEDGLDIGGALSATGTITVTFSDHKALNQIREFARRMSEQAPPPTFIAVEKGSEAYHELVRRIAAASDHTVAEVEAWIGLRCGEFRLCHAAAARKHKKKRDRHVWWHPVFGCYAWKKIEARA